MVKISDKQLKRAIDRVLDEHPADEELTHKKLRRAVEVYLNLETKSLDDDKKLMKRLYQEIMDDDHGSSDEEPVAKKSKKRKKDPNKPKKAKSAYMFFSQAKRPGVKEAFPDMSPVEVMKKMGELWSAATDEDKKPFDVMAQQDKIRYAKEMENYEPPSDVEDNGKKKKRKYGGPKKPKSSYMFFSVQIREKVKTDNPGIEPKEILKKTGELWRAMDDEAKEVYKKMALQAKEEYVVAKKKYDEEHPDSDDGRKKKKKRPGPKRAKSSYLYFTMENRAKIAAENPDLKQPEIMTKLGLLWKTLTDEDKKPYVKLSNQDKERYQRELEVAIANGTVKPKSRKKSSGGASRVASHAEYHAVNLDAIDSSAMLDHSRRSDVFF